jgi:precorrin-3B C17-methyltransferase
VLGYKLYMEQAEPFLNPTAKRLVSGMTDETKRAQMALDFALEGEKVCLVSGGDPGVYAMAGAVFEVAAAKKLSLGTAPGELEIKVIPGNPAVTVGAALLGAPLTHDFCAISLSDRLTKWEQIVMRLDLASKAGFVIALYNPKSHSRKWQLAEAVKVLMKNLSPQTPVGIASRCGREEEKVSITTLGELADAQVDMQTIVIVGNETSFVYQGRLITPRGYIDKYGGE